MKEYLKLNYLFLFYVISWEPLQALILKVDGAGRSVFLIAILTLLYNIHRKSFLKIITSFPYIYWGIWVLFAFIVTLQNYNFDLPYYSFFARLWIPLLVVWVISFEFNLDSKKVINTLLYSLLFSLLIIIATESTSKAARLGGELNANRIGLYAFSFLIILMYKYYTIRTDFIRKTFLFLLSSFPIFIIFKTGSRSAFAVLALLIAGQVLINRSKNYLKTFIVFFMGFIFLFFVFTYVIENTDIGKRIVDTTKQAERTGLETGTIFDVFGDRGFFYVLGFEIFLDHPVTGIGLRNFVNYYSGDVEMEPEIMVHLTELGAVGFILFILFNSWIGIELFKVRNFDVYMARRNTELLIITFISMIFLATTNTYHQVPAVFAIFGLMIAHIDDVKLKLYRQELDEKEDIYLDS